MYELLLIFYSLFYLMGGGEVKIPQFLTLQPSIVPNLQKNTEKLKKNGERIWKGVVQENSSNYKKRAYLQLKKEQGTVIIVLIIFKCIFCRVELAVKGGEALTFLIFLASFFYINCLEPLSISICSLTSFVHKSLISFSYCFCFCGFSAVSAIDFNPPQMPISLLQSVLI